MGDRIMATTINADTSQGLKLTSDTSGEIKLQSAGADIATVDSSGITLATGKDLTLSSTALDASASGIYLGGTASDNLLNDYETGTWTPTLGGATTDPTCTYAFNDGYYVRVGSLVHVKGGLRCTAKTGGSGQVVIRGLPFTVSSHLSTTAVEGNGSVGYWGGLSTAKSWVGVWAYNESTNLYWTSTSSTHTVVENLDNSNLGSTFQCRFSISYMTAD